MWASSAIPSISLFYHQQFHTVIFIFFSCTMHYTFQCLFLHLSSAISHKNYWDQLNSWKNLWKFWNGPLYRNNAGPSPYSILQYIGRVAIPKLVPESWLRYLETTLIMVGGELVWEFMWAIACFFLIDHQQNQMLLIKWVNFRKWSYSQRCFDVNQRYETRRWK